MITIFLQNEIPKKKLTSYSSKIVGIKPKTITINKTTFDGHK